MSFSFHPEAEDEFFRAVEYYDGVEDGLGYEFAIEVHSAIQRAVAFPKAWTVLEHEVRRSLVRRFPYGVLYAEEREGLLVIAIMNLHREPGHWASRTRSS